MIEFKHKSNQTWLDNTIRNHIVSSIRFIKRSHATLNDNDIENVIEHLNKYLEDYLPLHTDHMSIFKNLNGKDIKIFKDHFGGTLRKLKILELE